MASLDALLDQALVSLKLRDTSGTTAASVDANDLKRGLPKLQSGIDADSLYMSIKKGKPQLADVGTVQLADTTSQPAGQNKAALEQLNPGVMGETPRLTDKERQKLRESTSGTAWFDMPMAKMTPELQRDWQIIQMRHVLDPKRHYRKDKRKAPPKYCQTGTIIEGATEFYSARMSRKERKQTILDEFLDDSGRREYFRSRYQNLHAERAKGTRAWRRDQRSGRK